MPARQTWNAPIIDLIHREAQCGELSSVGRAKPREEPLQLAQWVLLQGILPGLLQVVPGRLLVGLLQVEKSNEPQNPPNDLNKALNKVLKNHLKKTPKKFFKNMNNQNNSWKDRIIYMKKVRKISLKNPLSELQWCFPWLCSTYRRQEVEKGQDLTAFGFLIQATTIVVLVFRHGCYPWSRVNLATASFLSVTNSTAFLLCYLLYSIVSRHHEKTLEEAHLKKLPLAMPQRASTTVTPQAKLVALHSSQQPPTLLDYRRRRDLPLLHAKILVGPIHAILFNDTIVYIVHIAADKSTKWRITATVGEVRKLRDCMQREVEDGDGLLVFEINSVHGMQVFLAPSHLVHSGPPRHRFVNSAKCTDAYSCRNHEGPGF
ncbi:hypothetical protein LEN26_008818 [Aphanomyces euteiches]|nr:hypothetical protein LEN26_008818 [Aphanomyces euteiches]